MLGGVFIVGHGAVEFSNLIGQKDLFSALTVMQVYINILILILYRFYSNNIKRTHLKAYVIVNMGRFSVKRYLLSGYGRSLQCQL